MDEYIQCCGYELVTMWECEWKALKRGRTVHNQYMYPTEGCYRMGESQIIEHIKNGRIFGAVEVDIEVPENIREVLKRLW